MPMFSVSLDEYNLFKKTIFVDQIQNWGPERILNAPKYVFEKNKTTINQNTKLVTTLVDIG